MFKDGAWTTPATKNVALAGPVDIQQPMYLFAYNEDGHYRFPVKVRVYSLKLWQKDAQSGEYELVRDLVPAKAPSGAAVLWDRVGNRFYRNAGDRYGLSAGSESQWFDGFFLRFR